MRELVKQQLNLKRKYQPIWEDVAKRALTGDFRPTVIRIEGLTDAWFKTVRKAFWNEKDLDQANRFKWRGVVVRRGDKIEFSVMAKKIEDRI